MALHEGIYFVRDADRRRTRPFGIVENDTRTVIFPLQETREGYHVLNVFGFEGTLESLDHEQLLLKGLVSYQELQEEKLRYVFGSAQKARALFTERNDIVS